MKTVAMTGIETFATTLEIFRVFNDHSGEYPVPLIDQFVGVSPAAEFIRRRLQLAAKSSKHILMTGPTGAGKSLAAELIHKMSSRAQSGQFLALNCGAIPSDLVESEMFGHEAGSFTGASRKRIGYFELANEGTLFLDEVGEAGNRVQTSLLRVLDKGSFFRLGGQLEMKVTTRVIAATNMELQTAIRDGKFRLDLYYRLYGLGIHIPPLTERFEDLSYLAASFVAAWEKSQNDGVRFVFRDEAIEKLYSHLWPGNTRELRAVIENAMLVADGNTVEEDHIEFPPIHIGP